MVLIQHTAGAQSNVNNNITDITINVQVFVKDLLKKFIIYLFMQIRFCLIKYAHVYMFYKPTNPLFGLLLEFIVIITLIMFFIVDYLHYRTSFIEQLVGKMSFFAMLCFKMFLTCLINNILGEIPL